MAALAALKDIAAYIAKDNPAAARKILAPLRATGFALGARAPAVRAGFPEPMKNLSSICRM